MSVRVWRSKQDDSLLIEFEGGDAGLYVLPADVLDLVDVDSAELSEWVELTSKDA